jgi:hypothetical protein
MHRAERKTGGGPLTATAIHTAVGVFTAQFSDRGLARLDFPPKVPQIFGERVQTEIMP